MSLPAIKSVIPPMTLDAIQRVRNLEAYAKHQPQIKFGVEHFLHGGMYSRTIKIPAGSMLTGALIKLETVIVVNGNVQVFIGDDFQHIVGYNVLPASKNRKQIFVAVEDTNITMLFPTQAKTVKQAEEEFTDEWRQLTTRTHEV